MLRRIWWLSFLAILVAAYAYKVFLALHGAEFLALYVTGDDAYYYFEIARNIAHGLGSTADGLAPTNGYHPLWMMLLIPIFYLFGHTSILPVQIALIVSIAFDIAGMYVLYRLLKKITASRIIAGAGILLWVLTPANYFDTNIGLETGLAVFLAFLFLWQLTRVAEQWTLRRVLVLSIIAGFMMLARTDYVFIAGAPFVVWLFMRPPLPRLRLLLAYMIPATLTVSPWLIWNISTFGTVVQTSGAAFQAVQWQLVKYSNPYMNPLLLGIKAALGDMATSIQEMLNLSGAGVLYLLILGFLAGGVVIAKRAQKNPLLLTLVAFTFSLTLFFVFQVGVRHAFRIWYFVPLLNVLPVLWIVYGAEQLKEVRALRVGAFVCIPLIAFSFFYDYWQNYRIPRPTNNEGFYKAAQWINTHVPEGETVGALNSGIVAYFSERRVVNLDGLVNNNAGRALADRHLYDYAKSIGIGYLVDWEGAVRFKFRSSWGVPITDHIEKLADIYMGSSEMTAYRFK